MHEPQLLVNEPSEMNGGDIVGEVLALLLVLGALVGTVIFMLKPATGGSFWSRFSSTASSGGSRSRQGSSAVIVLVSLQVAQLIYSGALSFVELGHAGLDAATFLVIGALVIFGSTMALGRRVLTVVGAVLGIVNLAIQHGLTAAVSVALIVLLLVTLAAMIGRLVGSR